MKDMSIKCFAKHDRYCMYTAFRSIKLFRDVQKNFCIRLSNLAAKIDFRQKFDAMNKVHKYADTKANLDGFDKQVASRTRRTK